MAESTETLHGRHGMSSDVNLTPKDIPCSSVKNGEDISKGTIPQQHFSAFSLRFLSFLGQGIQRDSLLQRESL